MEAEIEKLEAKKLEEETWFFDGKERLEGVLNKDENESE